MKHVIVDYKDANDDWQCGFNEKYINKRTLTVAKKLSKRLLKEYSQTMVLVVDYESCDDPIFQEFYYNDGTKFKMF